MTHTINSDTKLLSIDITRTHILRWERVQEEIKRAGKKWGETESKESKKVRDKRKENKGKLEKTKKERRKINK